MGLFGFRKKEVAMVIPEPNQNEIDWFFTEEAKSIFEKWVKLYKDEMWEEWGSLGVFMEPYMSEEDEPERRTYPCTFFADYFRALKTIVHPRLVFEATDLAIDGDAAPAIPYPDCLKPECNPLINFAIKMRPIFYRACCNYDVQKLQHTPGVTLIVELLKEAFLNGVDASNQSWIYEESLWLDRLGFVKDETKIRETIWKKWK